MEQRETLPDVRSLIDRLGTVSNECTVQLQVLDRPFGDVLAECRKQNLSCERLGPGLWKFNVRYMGQAPTGPSAGWMQIGLLGFRAGCLLTTVSCLAIGLLSLVGKHYVYLGLTDNWLVLEGKFNGLAILASIVASLLVTIPSRKPLLKVFKVYLGLGSRAQSELSR
jgi:hypothetical protein